ncbi:MAG: ABC transporter permease [Streptococcaceae bacterium]|jgi:ABC-2 type transport system permease protein|nr:ABC transporter permease [Streptococcaceae bacterium]
MLNLLSNKIYRMKSKKTVFIMAMIVMPLIIGIAIFFTDKVVSPYRIAYVTDTTTKFDNNPAIQVKEMNSRPPESDLALGKYTAIVGKKENNLQVSTFQSEDVKNEIQTFFLTGKLNNEKQLNNRGTGTNVLGFILMFILIQGVALTTFFPEDRDNSNYKRILTSPISNKKYLLSQGIFTFICLFIPAYLAVSLTHLCFGVVIGFSLGTLALLMAILAFFATAFALFMATVFDRNVGLITSGIAIVTCILAGCFFEFTSGIKLFDFLLNLLPQKGFMDLVNGVEHGTTYLNYISQLIYLGVWSIGFWLIGSFITNRRLRRGIY